MGDAFEEANISNEEDTEISVNFEGSKGSKCNARNVSEFLFAEQVVSECQKSIRGDRVSELTFRQFQSMDSESKNKLNNRVRQWALKARNSLPNEHGLFCLVLSHLLKNAHRYFKLDGPSDFQKHVLEENSVSQEKREQIVQDFINANKKVREIGLLKSKNRIKEQEKSVSDVKGECDSLRQISRMSGISVKMVHIWFSKPKAKKHKASACAQLKKDKFEQFLLQDSISFEHPSKKFAGKRFLHDTMEITRKKYLDQSEYHKNGIIS